MEPIIFILNACINQDHRYQKILYERYRGFALKIVFRYIFQYERAQDVVTDGFVKVFTHLSQFRSDNGPDTEKILMGWMKSIMVNAAIDEVRRMQLIPVTSAISEHVLEITDKNDDADQLIVYRDLMLLLEKLPVQYRLVFNMYVIDGFGHQDIANALNISVTASKSRLSRARALIQKYIREQEHIVYVSPEPRYG